MVLRPCSIFEYRNAKYCTQSFLSIQRGLYILFSVVISSSPPSHHGSVCVLPVISLYLTNTVSPVWACLIIWWERFRGTQKEDDRRPLSIQYPLSLSITMVFIYSLKSNVQQGAYIRYCFNVAVKYYIIIYNACCLFFSTETLIFEPFCDALWRSYTVNKG